MKADGRGSTVTAAAALMRACQRMELSAAGRGGASVATVCARYLEHLGTSVRSAQHAETPVPLQGEDIVMPFNVNKGVM